MTSADRVRFILVRPMHPGNIGATARAMKNMGFRRLVVVSDTPPDLAACAPMATSARDVLEALEHHTTLEDALEGVGFAVATTGRPRHWYIETVSSRALGPVLWPRASDADVAVLFGQEDFGLDNEALARCQIVCEIPTAGVMKSLNLAQATLVVAYELMLSQPSLDLPPLDTPREVVGLDALHPIVEAWIEAWVAVGFMRGRNPEQFRATLTQLLGRAAMEPREVGLLLGFFNKLRHYLVRTGGLQPPPVS